MTELLVRYYGAQRIALRKIEGPTAAAQAVEAYFQGDLSAIDKLATQAEGTAFQSQVWEALRRIPAGQIMSYGALAREIGRPGASRAVGLANGANPIAIVVPCHRVIGADASLTGYGGGIERKRWLLDHERAHCASPEAIQLRMPL